MYNMLVVDDEKIEREGIHQLVKICRLPIKVTKAANGEDAINMLKQGNYDLLMTDIKMPFMDGLTLAQKAKSLNPDIKILIFSAYGEFDFAQKAIKLHVNNYILKPIDVDAFRETMDDIVEELDNERGYSRLEEMDLSDSSKAKAINEAIRIIHSDYYKNISLDYLASQVYLNPAYFSVLFKKETGESVVKYIQNVRIEKACEMLTKTNMKIVDIGKRIGYGNLSYFCMVFKKCKDISPAKYREKSKANVGDEK